MSETRSSPRPFFVVSDVHGHLDELVEALRDAGLLSTDRVTWAGGDARLWFLGDYVDRGPDGVGVLNLVRRLGRQAPRSGGYVGALLGNHELMLLAALHFPDAGPASSLYTYYDLWRFNGGRRRDLVRLNDDHVAWLSGLPVMALVADHLLVHSDTTAYRELGQDLDSVNAAVTGVLAGRDPVAWGDCLRILLGRRAFRDPEAGPRAVREMLATFGGRWLVHGHTPVPDFLQCEPDAVTTALQYAGGAAVAVDGGLPYGGPCLVVRLPLDDPDPA